MIVSYLPDPESHPLWEGIKALLEPACEGEVLGRNELVWVAIDGPTIIGVGTTAIDSDGTAEILACGGVRHREWVSEALLTVEAWARDAGASRLVLRGRRGWQRYCAGWDSSTTDDEYIFEKDLTGGQEEVI